MRKYEMRHGSVVIVIDKNQKIVFVSEDSLEILGYLPDELEGQLITVLMNPRQQRVHQSHIDNYISNGRYRAEVGRFKAIKKDTSTIDVDVWINSKHPFYINDEPFICGILWDSDIIDRYNNAQIEQRKLMIKIESLAQSWIDEKKATTNELINIKAMLGIKLNPLMSDEQKNMSIQIINEGGKASQDTNVDKIDNSGDMHLGDQNKK